MPSSEHQWLLLWVARKMTHDGYFVRGLEGPAPQGGLWNHLGWPFAISGMRPDAWGISPLSGQLAIGEAKTAGDLGSSRTLMQLRLFGYSFQRNTQTHCPLYIAIPRSAAPRLDQALIRAGLAGRPHVMRLHIPDCLLEDPANESA